MIEENLMCPICGGLHPAGHRDKEFEDKLKAIEEVLDKFSRSPAKQTCYATMGLIKKILEAEG